MTVFPRAGAIILMLQCLVGQSGWAQQAPAVSGYVSTTPRRETKPGDRHAGGLARVGVEPFGRGQRDAERGGRVGRASLVGTHRSAPAAAPTSADWLRPPRPGPQTPARRPPSAGKRTDDPIGPRGDRVRAGAAQPRPARIGVRPAVAIIGEPPMMRVIEGHKGCYEYTTEFTGLEGHGSQPARGGNAVEYATRYVARLLDLGERLKQRAPTGSR